METADRRPCAVRPAGPDDLAAVLAVYARREVADAPEVDPSALEQRTWARMMATPDLTVYLAEAAGEAVGTGTLLLMPNLTYGCAPTAFVEAVVVASGHRRQGVATTMVRRLLDDARSAGCNKVQLLSHKRHATDGAHRLYTALSFEAEAEGFRIYLGEPPESVRAARTRSAMLGDRQPEGNDV